jgi:two-component system sensor kinase
MVENQTDMVIKFNPDGEILFASPSYSEYWDVTRKKL